jgi:hypothetical protein
LAKGNPGEKNSNEIVDLDGLPQSTIMSEHQDDSKIDGMDKEEGPAQKMSKFHSAKSGHASQMATSWTNQKSNTLSEPVLDIEEEDDYDGLSYKEQTLGVPGKIATQKRKRKIPFYIIEPEDTLRGCLDFVLVIAVLYSVFVSPLKLAIPEAFNEDWIYMDMVFFWCIQRKLGNGYYFYERYFDKFSVGVLHEGARPGL